MENQKKPAIPVPPKTPATPSIAGTPGTPSTAGVPGTPVTAGPPSAGSLPASSPAPVGDNAAAKMPKMPKMPKLPKMQNTTKMPDTSIDQFAMSKFMEMQMEHHKTHHLDANGDCKPHLKKEGFKYYKKYMG